VRRSDELALPEACFCAHCDSVLEGLSQDELRRLLALADRLLDLSVVRGFQGLLEALRVQGVAGEGPEGHKKMPPRVAMGSGLHDRFVATPMAIGCPHLNRLQLWDREGFLATFWQRIPGDCGGREGTTDTHEGPSL